MELDFLGKASRIIEQNLMNTQFTTVELSKGLFMSRSHLHRKLYQVTGKNTTQFIRDIRLEHAAKLLSNRDKVISEVAFKTGFSNLSWFAKCFKQKYGVSPSQYKRNYK